MDTLQDQRQVWKRLALEGSTSSFVIPIASPHLVTREPNETLKEICRRLMELYMPGNASRPKLVDRPGDCFRGDAVFGIGVGPFGQFAAKTDCLAIEIRPFFAPRRH
jgi:hypothetical protein